MDVDWIDLPSSDYEAVLGYSSSNVNQLNQLIELYNQIPKDAVSTLSCRIKKLNKILVFIDHWVNEELSFQDKKKHLLWIQEIAEKKRNYLEKLLEIYTKNGEQKEALIAYHHDFQDLKDQSKLPVVLTNHRFFSLKMREYWGDFWFESLDPCHRRLTPFIEQWERCKKDNPTLPHFFLWLETQYLPKYIPRVRYFTKDEKEETRVWVEGGLFWHKVNGEKRVANLTDRSKKFLFIIDITEEIFVAEEEVGVSHSSFNSGKAVLGAGFLYVDEGILSCLALESGHYMPSIEIGHQILRIFQEKGARFLDPLEVVFFHDRNKYTAEVTELDLVSLGTFRESLENIYLHKVCI